MALFQAGDIVLRRGTIGAQKDPFEHPVVVISVNDRETIGGQTLYTCAPLTHNPQSKTGAVPVKAGTDSAKYLNLSKLLIAGEGSFCCPAGASQPLIGRLTEQELSSVRGCIDALFVPSGAHLGKVFYSATPAHDGTRGKVNRPYAAIGEVGRGSGNFLVIPVSSSPSNEGNGFQISDLQSAGLLRDEGEASYTRFAWMATIDSRTSSKEAGRLSEADKGALYRQFLVAKKFLLSGGNSAAITGAKVPANPAPNIGRGLFPHGLGAASRFGTGGGDDQTKAAEKPKAETPPLRGRGSF
jgi:hypothetical protein